MGDNTYSAPTLSHPDFSSGYSEEPSTSSLQDNEPKTKRRKTNEHHNGRRTHQMRFPIILPKLSNKSSQNPYIRLTSSPPLIAPSSSNPRPLISLLDRTEFRDRTRVFIAQPVAKPKKCYYTEISEIRREFGIPEIFDTTKPNTMSGLAMAEKLQLLQRMRGENKFLLESIKKKQNASEERAASIDQIHRSTNEIIDHCHLLRESLQELESDNSQMRNQLK